MYQLMSLAKHLLFSASELFLLNLIEEITYVNNKKYKIEYI